MGRVLSVSASNLGDMSILVAKPIDMRQGIYKAIQYGLKISLLKEITKSSFKQCSVKSVCHDNFTL